MTPRGLVLAVALGACGGEAPPAPEPVPSTPPRIKTVSPEPGPDGSAMQVNGGDAVPVQLQFTTISALHQGFFGQPRLVRKLGAAMGACTTHTVQVDVVWSQAELQGRIMGVVPPGSTSCGVRKDGEGFDLSPLVPMSRGLAGYRDGVAGTSDFRISSFVVGLDLIDEGIVCRLTAVGQHPPDGTRFHPCVQVNGEPVCGEGDPEQGITRLVVSDPAARRRLERCLTP